MSDGREEREEREKRIEQENRKDREDRVNREDLDEWKPDVDSQRCGDLPGLLMIWRTGA